MSLSSIDTSFTFASVETTGYELDADVDTSLFETIPQVPLRNVHLRPLEDLTDIGTDVADTPEASTSDGSSALKSVSIFLGIAEDWLLLKTPRSPILL
jgi:hypothetical protein